MDFASPRFQGHQRLEQILNQPPGGTQHLQEGHTGTDVEAVQRALWDLCWTFSISPIVNDVNQFVIGTFGPITTKTVTAFRTHFGIIFAGATSATGTVGTATLQKLDSQIVQYDASAAAIGLRAHLLQLSGTPVTLDNDPVNDPYPGMVTKNGGVEWHCWIDHVQGAWLHKASTGAYYVVDPIYGAYLDHGYGGGSLGFPVSDTYVDSGGGLRNDFENGSLVQRAGDPEIARLDPDPVLREVLEGRLPRELLSKPTTDAAS